MPEYLLRGLLFFDNVVALFFRSRVYESGFVRC